MKDVEEYCPNDKQNWRNWLQSNHNKKDAVWLIFYKKKSPNYNLSWSESVDEALCFGWIDSVKKTIDSEKYKQYFSKRKVKSNWSKVNKDKVQTLIEQGLDDAVLNEQLKPENLIAAAIENGYPLEFGEHHGYDHGYHFIATFIDKHLHWHYEQLMR